MNENKKRWLKEEFEKISENIKDKYEISYFDFLRIRNFKSRLLTKEKEEKVREVTKEAFKKKSNPLEAIQILLNLEGVKIPTASTILAMRFPDEFAIIDRKVIEKIRKEEWLSKYADDPHIYVEYLEIIHKLKQDDETLRDCERRLFESD